MNASRHGSGNRTVRVITFSATTMKLKQDILSIPYVGARAEPVVLARDQQHWAVDLLNRDRRPLRCPQVGACLYGGGNDQEGQLLPCGMSPAPLSLLTCGSSYFNKSWILRGRRWRPAYSRGVSPCVFRASRSAPADSIAWIIASSP